MSDDKKAAWRLVYDAALNLGNESFTIIQVIEKVQSEHPEVNERSLRSHIIGMAPNHPQSKLHVNIARKYPYLNYLGNGMFTLKKDVSLEDTKPEVIDETLKEQPKRKNTQTKIEEETITDVIQLGEFYILVTEFEKALRELIKDKFGKGFYKRMQKEIPEVYDKWVERKESDEYWGIETENDLINYSLFTDYLTIIKKFKNMFLVIGMN